MELKDTFGRIHDYLRISLTDVCNFRCLYCLPEEHISFMPQASHMQADEIFRLAEIFVGLGVRKIRLTGGEPLVRKDAAEIIQSLSKLPVELTLTTNGSRIADFIHIFRESGIRSINFSLDTLQKERFEKITRRNQFDAVWNNLWSLVDNGFHIKLNAVAMRGVNDDEINDFVALTESHPLHVRFIEFMPFPGNHWENEKLITHKQLLETISTRFRFLSLLNETHDTAKKYFVPGHKGTFAFISTMSQPFCEGCNRIRLTADGKLRNCLFSKSETDLLTPLRQGIDIVPLIRENILRKKLKLGGNDDADWASHETSSQRRPMMSIGG